ncbi:MAG: YXWGXW repeat-containing protein [Acidobacteriaceae bacterium]
MKARFIVRALFLSLALLIIPTTLLPTASSAQVIISVSIAPPMLPIYTQPYCPGPDYIWIPGYWAYGPDGYYWVPGTWVLAPEPGLLWTPGYWGWSGIAFIWHPGYWGPQVGFYGGVYYGFGYNGYGYDGGYWRNSHFFYNRAVNRIRAGTIRNVYDRPVNIRRGNRVSYNGGRGGINMRPTSRDLAAERQRRFEATPVQVQHREAARNQRELRMSVNRGRPPIAATQRPGEFRGREVQPTRPQAQPPAVQNNRQQRQVQPQRQQQIRPEPQRQVQPQQQQRQQQQQRPQQQQQRPNAQKEQRGQPQHPAPREQRDSKPQSDRGPGF